MRPNAALSRTGAIGGVVLWLCGAALVGGCAGQTEPLPFAVNEDRVRMENHSPAPVEASESEQTNSLAATDASAQGNEDEDGPQVIGEWRIEIATRPEMFHEQDSDDLCWAAGVQTVYAILGLDSMTQDAMREQFVYDLPDEYREAAFRREMQDALAPGYRPQFRGRVVVEVFDSMSDVGMARAGMTDEAIIESVARGEPVLAAMRNAAPDGTSASGHMYVIYGVRYRELNKPRTVVQAVAGAVGAAADAVTRLFTGEKNADHIARHYEIVELTAFDPWYATEGGGPKVIRGADFASRCAFAHSPSSARKQFENELSWVSKYDRGPGIYVRQPLTLGYGEPMAYVTVTGEHNQ